MSLTFPLLASKDRLPRCVIIVENLPVPFDRRVWQEANALKEAGWEVSVICPTGKGYEALQEDIDGIHIYRHTLPPEANSAAGYFHEYAAAHGIKDARKYRGRGKIRHAEPIDAPVPRDQGRRAAIADQAVIGDSGHGGPQWRTARTPRY